jgi:hypothetical protein
VHSFGGQTINSDQFSQAKRSILAIDKVLAPGNFVNKSGFVNILDAGRFQ